MSLEIKYKQKFLKYKTKYLALKKSIVQTGGNEYKTIPNSGKADDILTNQCLWISIRDYLNFAKGITNLKIFENLKQPFGLTQDLNNTEFNLENANMTRAVTELAKKYNITLCFIPVHSSTNRIDLYGIETDGSVRCIQGSINPGQKDIVHIASYGGHFALIIAGPGFSVPKHPSSTITIPNHPAFKKIPKIELAIDNIKTSIPKCTKISEIIDLLCLAGPGPSNCYSSSVASLRKINSKDPVWEKYSKEEKIKAISTGSVANNIPFGPFYVLSIYGVRDKVIELLKLK